MLFNPLYRALGAFQGLDLVGRPEVPQPLVVSLHQAVDLSPVDEQVRVLATKVLLLDR